MRLHLATLVDDYLRHGPQPAVVVHRGIRSRVYTYRDLAELSHRFAAELIHRGIGPGERVVLWGQNGAEWIAAYFGCVLRGVLVVPLDAAGDPAFALRVIADTKPLLLVADRALLARLAAALPPSEAARAARFPFLVLEDLAALPEPPAGVALQEPGLGPDTPLQILFTSGTTSEPKGIVHTHRNVLASLEPIEREMQKYLRYERIVHPVRFLHTLPLSHVFGQFMGLWIPPLMAAEVHFESRLQASRLLELIRRHRISVLASVPRVLDLLRLELVARIPDLPARMESARGLSLWRRWWSFREVHRLFGLKFWALVCGGASLPAALESFWRELGLAVIQGYGMTETAALITLNHPFHLAQGSLGKPLPGREIRIGDDGEVLVRGEMVANARWQNGRITTLTDPWLATGDLVEQGREGELHFRGRKSETIVTAAGLNIHPEDVEAALNRQHGIEASAVVPLHTASGPEPVAVLLSRADPAQLGAAIAAANASLAEYQRVRRWKLWPKLDFPRTSLGKIQRRKVEHWVGEAAAEEAAEEAAKGSVAVKAVAGQTAGGPHTHAFVESEGTADPLALLVAIAAGHSGTAGSDPDLDRDLNLDSLARVQLQAELEQRLGIHIADEEFDRIATLADLRAELQAGLQITSQTASQTTSQSAQPNPLQAPSPATHTPSAQNSLPESARYRYPEWTLWPPVQALRRLFQELVMRPLVWFLGAPSVSRAEFPVPTEPLLIIANHVTFLDPALILYALPRAMRRKVAIAMGTQVLEDLRYGRNQGNWFLNLVAPLGYWGITVLFNVFPLPPGAGFRRSFAHAGWALDRGYHVLIFPEGRRSATLLPFRSGIGLLAREANAKILPVAMVRLGELKQEISLFHWGWFRSGILQLRVGKPLTPPLELAPELIAESLRRALASLLQP